VAAQRGSILSEAHAGLETRSCRVLSDPVQSTWVILPLPAESGTISRFDERPNAVKDAKYRKCLAGGRLGSHFR
jgi:hypothetical protein